MICVNLICTRGTREERVWSLAVSWVPIILRRRPGRPARGCGRAVMLASISCSKTTRTPWPWGMPWGGEPEGHSVDQGPLGGCTGRRSLTPLLPAASGSTHARGSTTLALHHTYHTQPPRRALSPLSSSRHQRTRRSRAARATGACSRRDRWAPERHPAAWPAGTRDGRGGSR